jgi:hypothetical protein
MGSAEENQEWVRRKIYDAGLTDRITAEAQLKYLASFAPEGMIFGMFAEIVEPYHSGYDGSNDEEAS